VRENAAAKARRYLCEGRVVLSRVDPLRVVAACRGDGTVYQIAYAQHVWSCTCPARTDQCAHLLAVRLVVAVDLAPTARPPPEDDW
jgi:uncharacterized Zn finger protein